MQLATKFSSLDAKCIQGWRSVGVGWAAKWRNGASVGEALREESREPLELQISPLALYLGKKGEIGSPLEMLL